MKWYYAVAIVVVAYLVLFRKRGSASGSSVSVGVYNPDTGDTWTPAQVQAEATAEKPLAGWYGVDTTNMTPAYTGSGWNPYPGWWRTGDGGWYLPDTGEWRSPGASPVPLAAPSNYQDPLIIDLSTPAAGVQAGGNGAYDGSIIY